MNAISYKICFPCLTYSLLKVDFYHFFILKFQIKQLYLTPHA
jgi:hypothetical protein